MLRLLLKEYGPEIVHIADITNTTANAITRFDMDSICNISKDIFKGLHENDCIHGKHVSLTRTLSQSFQDNTDLGSSEGECFAKISETIEDIIFPTNANITCNQSDANLQ